MRTIYTLILLLVLSTPLQAQTTSFTVSGYVFDEQGLTLPGATVQIKSLTRGSVTDQSGRFVMAGVPSGAHIIEVSYLGFQSQEREVTVSADIEVEFMLSPGIIQGEEVLVVSERLAGEAKALNQQRANMNVTNVVSTDQIGKFPDANVGDALKRIPSITVFYDQGEARFASIRGSAPQLNSVQINGERIPSAEAEIRTVQLDLIPSDMIQTIEVNKVLTADMDADAIGGSVNLITRAPSGGQRISLTAAGGYNDLRSEATSNFAAVFGNRFLDQRLGVVVSGSYHNNNLGSDNSEGEWEDDDGKIFIGEWDIRRYDLQRIRRSIAASLDYRPNSNSVIYFRSMYNHRDDFENRFRARFKLDEPNAQGVVEEAELRRQTKGGTDDIKNARLEDQRASSFALAGEHSMTKFRVDWQASYSRASEERPNERYVSWRVKDVPVRVDVSDLEKPTFSFVNASDTDLSNYSLREITEEFQFTEQNNYNARLDFTLPLGGSDAADNGLKAGYRLRMKDKIRENSFVEYEPTGSQFDNMSLQPTEDYSEADYLAGPYLVGTFQTPESLGDLDLDNSSLFERSDLPEEYAAGNYESDETVHAGYLKYNRAFSDQLSGSFGVRVEATTATFTGNEFNDDTESVTPVEGENSYTDVLPSALFRYEIDANTIVRAAWTNTLARPGFYELVPYREIAVEDNELSVGNPDLEPTRSMNFDVMVEKYFGSVGLISGGVFYKDIQDFIYVLEDKDAVDPATGRTYDAIFRPVNGATASLVGFEVAIQRQIDQLPGLGVFANYTYTSSSTENPGISDEKIDLPGTAEHSLNTSVSYNKGAVDLRVSFNYNSSYLDPDALDLTPGLERFYDAVTYLDVNGLYRVNQQLRVFFNANNLLNQPLRFYAGDKDRTYQAEYYGPTFNLGVKFDL
ncbi:MAG: TonB-dependent receptor [Bacteroidetes bacterium]|nr:TonB-dependent receptor [Bacteroidota bacterium]